MYQYGTANDYQNNQDNAFQYLNRKFAGRGLAMQAKISANSYGAEGMYGYRGASSAPLTLGEFEQNYRRRTGYIGNFSNANAPIQHRAMPAQSTKAPRAQSRPADNVRSAVVTQNMRADGRPVAAPANQRAVKPAERNVGKRSAAPSAVKRETASAMPMRRAVKKDKTTKVDEFMSKFKSGIGSLPIGAMLTVVVCAVSLMFIVGSSVLLSDASDDYADMQNEISALAKQEDELLIALEVKNDLRTIEDIAVNKLGMDKKDLITRQYIKLSDEDIIETYEEDNTNVGLSTLLTAIGGGN